MQETMKDDRILTINEVAGILRCSKTHVSNALAGRVPGIPKLAHLAMGRRKLVRREWLARWMDEIKK
jgi:hypothetical protein